MNKNHIHIHTFIKDIFNILDQLMLFVAMSLMKCRLHHQNIQPNRHRKSVKFSMVVCVVSIISKLKNEIINTYIHTYI